MRAYRAALLLTWSVLLFGSWSGATITNGPSTSGGGHSVVCRNYDGSIRSAQLLDLYEAKAKFQFKLRLSQGTLEEDFVAATRNAYRLQSANIKISDSEILKSLDRFMSMAKFTPAGKRPTRIFDVGNTIPFPWGCDLEQLAFFDDLKSEVVVDSEIWNRLDTLNQAALVTHELYYHVERQFLEHTSEGTRAFVAHIYASPDEVEPIFAGVPRNSKMCYTRNSNTLTSSSKVGESFFYVLPTSDMNGIILQLGHLMGRPIVAKAQAILPDLKWKVGYLTTGGTRKLVSAEHGTTVKRVPVVGSQRGDWELEVSMSYLQPVKIGLYQKGIKIAEANVENCFR